MRNCFTAGTAVTSSAGAVSQPIFHPVVLKVLPAEEIVTVRSRCAGKGRERHVPAAVEGQVLVHLVGDDHGVVPIGQLERSPASSSRSSTAPVGLCGELTRISRVRSVTAARELVEVEAEVRRRAAARVRCTPPASAMKAP